MRWEFRFPTDGVKQCIGSGIVLVHVDPIIRSFHIRSPTWDSVCHFVFNTFVWWICGQFVMLFCGTSCHASIVHSHGVLFCPCKLEKMKKKYSVSGCFDWGGHLLLSLYQYMYVHNMRDMHAIWGAIIVLSNTKYGVKGAGQTSETGHERSCSCSSLFSPCSCSYHWFLIEWLQIHEVFSLHHKNTCTDGQIVRLPRP